MLMDDRASKDDIERYLYKVASGSIGLRPNEDLSEKCAPTAVISIELRHELEAH